MPSQFKSDCSPERFWSLVNKDGPIAREGLTPCWLWTGAITKRCGYGQLPCGGTAHRYAWELENGPIQTGLCVLHDCDTPLCVRHLHLGTKKQNTQEMMARGRHRTFPGETNTQAKLTQAQVSVIKTDLHVSGRVLAKQFSVSSTVVYMIRRGERWKA